MVPGNTKSFMTRKIADSTNLRSNNISKIYNIYNIRNVQMFLYLKARLPFPCNFLAKIRQVAYFLTRFFRRALFIRVLKPITHSFQGG